ncbi:hypothetical protein P9112_006989 [Eukaryota sp. TZLM1-RC]
MSFQNLQRQPTRSGLASRGLSTPVTGKGVTSLQNVTVQNRPVTSHQHGLVGVSTSHGASRQVYDRNCVLADLNAQIKDVSQELQTLQSKIDRTNSLFQKEDTINKKKAKLSSQLDHLKAKLTDTNLVVDHLESGDAITVLNEMLQKYVEENNELSSKVDRMYDERKRLESEVESMKVQQEKVEEHLEVEVGRMSEEAKNKYESLKSKRDSLLGSISEADDVYGQLSMELESMKAKLSEDSGDNRNVDWILEYERLSQSIEELKAEISENSLNLTPAEEKDNLVKQMKQWNSEIQQAKSHTSALREENLELQDKIASFNSKSTSEGELDQKHLRKYELLRKQKGEIEDFFKKFPDMERDLCNQIRNQSSQVSDMIKFLVSELNITTSVGIDLDAFKGEGTTKQENSSEVLAMKKAELTKLRQMEESILSEEGKLRSSLRKIKNELLQFENSEQLAESTRSERQRLSSELSRLEKRSTFFKNVIDRLKSELLDIEKQLGRNNVALELAKMDKVFSIQQAKISKNRLYVEKYNDIVAYTKLKSNCQELADTLNRNLKTSVL